MRKWTIAFIVAWFICCVSDLEPTFELANGLSHVRLLNFNHLVEDIALGGAKRSNSHSSFTEFE
jgi:hypothetical protein